MKRSFNQLQVEFSTLFEHQTFVIASTYSTKRSNEIKSILLAHGGKVTTKVSKQVDYLVQSWLDDDCDDRLERCCNLDIIPVPFDFLEHCIAVGV